MTQPMRGGTLSRFITIQQRTTSKDTFGGQSPVWATVTTCYALIEALSGSERAAAASYSTDVSHRVTIRYQALLDDPRVIATYRIQYGTRIFQVLAGLNVDEANRTIELMCAEGLNYG
jgi:SPP1 family predicted phage head-tail adaptor